MTHVNQTPKLQSTYGYDDISRLTSAVNGAGTVTFGYDNRNRVTSTTDVFNQALVYEYERTPTVNQKRLKLNGSLYATYNYDNAERLSNIINASDSTTISFGYYNDDLPQTRTYPNGVSTSYEFDNMRRLKRLTDTGPSGTMFDRQYSYNSANQISQIVEPSLSRVFGYDNADRLTSVTGGATENYLFDDVGNRTSSHRSSSYGYQPFNKIASTQTATYGSDANGNMTTKSEGSNFWRYTWDYENRMAEAATRKTKVRYRYDALGRRVARNLGGGRELTKFTYDGQDVLIDDNFGTLTKYLNGTGIDNKLRLQTGSSVNYFLADQLGGTNGLVNSSGVLVASNSYDSFGNPTSPTFPSRYQFTGREFDSFSGLQFSRARWYDPNLGRFISEDPIGFGGGDVNLYGYVHNNSVNKTDPFGLIDPIVYQDPSIYPQTGREASCILGDKNPWLGLEYGGNIHLLYAGAGASGGVEVNPLTGEICLFVKGTGRLGIGAFAGIGPKLNFSTGPDDRPDGIEDSVEPAGDIALGGGGKMSLRNGRWHRSPPWRTNGSGNVSNSGVGIGIGANSPGIGASVGVDFGRRKVWCFNRPKEACPCK